MAHMGLVRSVRYKWFSERRYQGATKEVDLSVRGEGHAFFWSGRWDLNPRPSAWKNRCSRRKPLPGAVFSQHVYSTSSPVRLSGIAEFVST